MKKVLTGPKPVRSDNITMRFDPRLKYMASVAGRHLRQSLSTVVEVAISKYLETVIITTGGDAASIADLTTRLWSPFEATRFVLLADHFPFLLSYEEEVLWSLIQRDRSLWRTLPGGEEISRDGNAQHGIKHDVLREKWASLIKAAEDIAHSEPTITLGGMPSMPAVSDRGIPASLTQLTSKAMKGKIK